MRSPSKTNGNAKSDTRGLARFRICGYPINSVLIFLNVLVAIGFVGILWASTRRIDHRPISCRSNLKQIGYSLGMYQYDNSEWMPPDFLTLIDNGYMNLGFTSRDPVERIREIARSSVLDCPSSQDEPLDPMDIEGAFSYYFARTVALPEMGASQVPIVWEKKVWHPLGPIDRLFNPESVYVIYGDLHVAKTSLEDLERLINENAHLYEKPPRMPEAVER